MTARGVVSIIHGSYIREKGISDIFMYNMCLQSYTQFCVFRKGISDIIMYNIYIYIYAFDFTYVYCLYTHVHMYMISHLLSMFLALIVIWL